MAETLAGDGITDLHSQEHMHWQNTFNATSSDPFLYHVNRWTNWYNNSHAIVLHQSRPLVKPQPPTVVTQAFGNLMPYKIVRELGNADLVVRQKALLWAVEYLSVAENRARCFAAGLLPTLMKHFQEDDLHMQRHLALAFKHAAGSQDGCCQMSQLGAVKGLVNMLSSRDKVVRGNAFAALDAALSSEVVRTELATGGTTLQFILDRINNDTEKDCFKFGLKVLFKSLRGGLDQKAIGQLLKADAIKTCVRLICHIDAEVKESAAQLLCLLALTIKGRAISVEQQVVADLLRLLQDLEPLVQAAAAAALMRSLLTWGSIQHQGRTFKKQKQSFTTFWSFHLVLLF